jgi:quercetin dioxygenase-like cupin family protein
MNKVSVAEKFALFDEKWSPKIVGELNGQYVKLVKVQGEFFIVPAGVEHKPEAPEEAHVILLEPASAVNTGDVRDERTREHLDWI